jgi:hypothetical protein
MASHIGKFSPSRILRSALPKPGTPAKAAAALPAPVARDQSITEERALEPTSGGQGVSRAGTQLIWFWIALSLASVTAFDWGYAGYVSTGELMTSLLRGGAVFGVVHTLVWLLGSWLFRG